MGSIITRARNETQAKTYASAKMPIYADAAELTRFLRALGRLSESERVKVGEALSRLAERADQPSPRFDD